MRGISLTAIGVVLAMAGSAQAAILYSAAVETSSRFNPGLNALGGAAAPTQQDVTFDDVPIANPLNFTQVSITKVTYGIRRLASAPAIDLNFFATTLTTPVAPQTISDAIDTPFTSLGTTSLVANGATALTQLVVVDLTASPVVMNLNNGILGAGFGVLAIGLQFSGASAADGNNGWRQTTPSVGSANANQLFWLFDSDITPSKRGLSFGVPSATVPPSTFYIVLEGDLIPAPGAAGLLGLGGLMLARRRR